MRPPLSQTSARSRAGSLRTSSSSPGASVLKSPTSTCGPGCSRADRGQQRAQLVDAPPLGPRRVHGAQVHAEHAPRRPRRHDLEKGVARHARPVPRRVRDRHAAHEAERLAGRATPTAPCRCPRASRSTTAGCVASCSTTRSGAARADHRGERRLAAGAAVADVVGQESKDHSSGLSMSVRYGWSSRSPRNCDHDVARRLDVDRPAGHRHQRLAQRHQVGRDVGIFLRQRPRVHAGHEEAGDLEQADDGVADQRQVEVARARAVGVERRAVLPALAGDRAAAQHDARCRRGISSRITRRTPRTARSLPPNASRMTLRALRFVTPWRPFLEARSFAYLPSRRPCRTFCVSSTQCRSSSPIRASTPRTPPASTSARSIASTRARTSRSSQQATMLYIHPEECIDCGACVPACPVSAIYDSPDSTPRQPEGAGRGQRRVPRAAIPAPSHAPKRSCRDTSRSIADLLAIAAAERAAAHGTS